MSDPDVWHPDWLPIAGQNSMGWSALLGATKISPVRSADPSEFNMSSAHPRRGDCESLCAAVTVWLTAADRGWATWNEQLRNWIVDRARVPLVIRETLML